MPLWGWFALASNRRRATRTPMNREQKKSGEDGQKQNNGSVHRIRRRVTGWNRYP